MRDIFDDHARVQARYDIEAALAQEQAALGIIPQHAGDDIAAEARVENLDLDAIAVAVAVAVQQAKHPLVPALRALQALCAPACGEYLHFGPTTQDILDTGTMLQTKRAHAVFLRDLTETGRPLYQLAKNHRAARTGRSRPRPDSGQGLDPTGAADSAALADGARPGGAASPVGAKQPHQQPEFAMTVRNVAVIVGSLRAGSFNRLMAHALAAVAPASLTLSIIEIGALVPFNQDFETGVTPPEYIEFRAKILPMEAVLFVTPEYNRSMPGVLKNAVDVGSRPYGKSVWNGKPAAIVSVGAGATGGFGANHHLRQSLVFLNMPTMPAPEAYIGGAAGLFDEAGNLKSDATRTFVADFMKAFAAWVEKFAA